MSKSTKFIVAGAAALAIAAVPAVASFADTADRVGTVDYTVTINPTLTFKIDTTTVTGTAASPTAVTPTAAQALTLENGAADTTGKTITLNATTNNLTGYTINAADEDAALVGQGTISSKSIAWGDPAANTSAWKLASSNSGADITDAKIKAGTAVIATKAASTASDAGEDTTVTYTASVSKSQEAGTYKGTVTYTLKANA